jgi:beta-glucosidase
MIRGVSTDRKDIGLAGGAPMFRAGAGIASQSFFAGPGYRILSASKTSFFTSYQALSGDTATNLIITLLDSSRFASLPAFRNPGLPPDARVADLVSRMTMDEKLSQLQHESAAVERLGIIEYNWWNECLHGVGIAYLATVFPQAIGMAAAWDTSLIAQVTTAIGDEARAKYHRELDEYGKIRQMRGLTFFSPNINIFRDPRWGRGQETYGEDPYLSSRIAVAFVKGLQGNDSRYLKAGACAKHFAVHSGPESLRHTFDAVPQRKDLWQTYLPAFRACVREAGVSSVMCAYNRIEGIHACQNGNFLNGILRDIWGFDGYVVSDCGADISLAAGCDLICYLAWANQQLYSSAEPESLINLSVGRLMRVRFELGMFDPPQLVPYASIPYSVVDCEKHRQLARETARKSIVLLKNNAATLPLGRPTRSIAVVGPHADWESILWGNYNGTPSYTITPLAGIRQRAGAGVTVYHAQGCGLTDSLDRGFAEAESLARAADVVIACCGLSSETGSVVLEGENMDRTDLGLPSIQEELVRRVHATGTPVVLVLINGGALSVTWADSNVSAIVEAWYGGQEGGRALADMLFGDENPGGKLPFTVYKSVADLPDFTDYAMENGRTYRYFTGEPLYPFGYGLSYTTFSYSNMTVSPASINTSDDTITITADITNSGNLAGDEVLQLYVSGPFAAAGGPLRELKGFSRIHLSPSETKTVPFILTPYDLSRIDDSGNRLFEPGTYTFSAGGGQPGARGTLSSLSQNVTIGGSARNLEL